MTSRANQLLIVISAALPVLIALGGTSSLDGEWWGGLPNEPVHVMYIDGVDVRGCTARPYGYQKWTGTCTLPTQDGQSQLTITQSAFSLPSPMPIKLTQDGALIVISSAPPLGSPSDKKCTFRRTIKNPTINDFIGRWYRRNGHTTGADSLDFVLRRDGTGNLSWDASPGKWKWAISNDQVIPSSVGPKPKYSPESFTFRALSTNFLVVSATSYDPMIFTRLPDSACSTVEGSIPFLIFATLNLVPTNVVKFTFVAPDGPAIEFNRKEDSIWQAEGRYRHDTTYQVSDQFLLENRQKMKFRGFTNDIAWSEAIEIQAVDRKIVVERKVSGVRFIVNDQTIDVHW